MHIVCVKFERISRTNCVRSVFLEKFLWIIFIQVRTNLENFYSNELIGVYVWRVTLTRCKQTTAKRSNGLMRKFPSLLELNLFSIKVMLWKRIVITQINITQWRVSTSRKVLNFHYILQIYIVITKLESVDNEYTKNLIDFVYIEELFTWSNFPYERSI